jgi:transcriptional regulator with XRE-family HTH domain
MQTNMSSGNPYLKNLKILRKRKGWTQEKLAQQAGISFHTLIKVERGYIKNPKLETLIKLAKALGVSLDKLVGSQK